MSSRQPDGWPDLRDINTQNVNPGEPRASDVDNIYQLSNNQLKKSGNSNTERLSFVAIVIAIVISWILVAFWTRVLENLFYVNIGFDGESFWQTLLVAVMLSVFFFALVWFLQSFDAIKESESKFETRIADYGGLLIPQDFNSEDLIIPPFD